MRKGEVRDGRLREDRKAEENCTERGGGAEVKWKESEKKRMKERKRWDGVVQNRAGEGGQERELKG